ncbi:hypothetical protein E2320_004470 [Naja naja]|nr:hypothetical protein E2320_004470 [Naja naja]
MSAGTWLGLEGGMLCQLIRSPDYNLFPNSAVFESNFIQVAGENQGVAGLGANGPAGLTKRGLALQLTRGSRVGGGRFPQVTKKGKWMDITHTPTIVTLAVTSSDPCLPLPNVLLMANQQAPLQRVHPGSPRPSQMDLTSSCPSQSLTASVALPRLLPLRYVRLSVHSASQRILRLQTVTKTVYYLQLHHKYPEAVFALWSRLTNILENGLSTTTKDPAIPIRHCLHPDMVMRSAGVIKKVGRKVSGVTTQFSPSPKRNLEKPRRVSFQAQQQSLEDTSGPSSDIKVLYYDLPPPLVCARCKGRLPRTEPRKCRLDARRADSDAELAPWMDRRTHGLWQQETPTWLQPLCRLSCLAAAGWK